MSEAVEVEEDFLESDSMDLSSVESDTTPLAEANNYLAINLFKLVAKERGNAFFSPFCISASLAMLYLGADGETAAELKRVGGYEMANLTKDDILSSFQEYLTELTKNPDECVVTVANSILCQTNMASKEEYIALLKETFNVLYSKVDFSNESQDVLNKINDWVKEKTHYKIESLLDSFNPLTTIVLLNAVYFKGSWLHEFDKQDTFLQCFYNQGEEDNAKEVDMMHLKESLFYAEFEDYRVMQLPYKEEKIAMLLILPTSKLTLDELGDLFAPTFIKDLKENMHKQNIHVELPKFDLEYSKSLNSFFQSIGLKNIFQNGAELGGICETGELQVTDMIHKAAINVNERGCKAPALSTVTMTTESLIKNPTFVADHPFIFAIYDTRNNMILFLGKVEEI